MVKNKGSSITKVILLGTGNPNPDPEHSGCSVLILVGETPYIIDFGANVVRQAAALTAEYGGPLQELKIRNLCTAFCTHLHSDHTLGLADLILTPWIMGRKKPLAVYGPSGMKEMTENILEAYKEDIHYRIDGIEPINKTSWKVITHKIQEGFIYEDNNIQVKAFHVHHGTMKNAFGFRFTTPDKTIVISGDTTPCENIINYSQNADILIHEVYSQKGFVNLTAAWKKYHAAHHTSSHQLAEIANKCHPRLLIAYHTLFWGTRDEDILEEIKRYYKGNVAIGRDLQIFH
ncbi:MAG: MBL fold metallo-hydrolase [Candidatus Marinimicrobia bacterium]|nr:MBL fold metallo-hydrolase [Candidatus Neomarinimicrobiota bacterium]